jgi:hypothetical protein
MTYVAITSGEVPYEGKLEEIIAGITYIADDHEIVRRFPHMFKKAAGSMMFRKGVGSSGRTRSTAVAPKALARDQVELRASARSPISIELHEGARRVIVNEVLDWASDYEGESRESGGFLFGRRSTDGLELTFAAYAGESTERGKGRLRLDVGKARSVEAVLHRQHTREHLAGNYHSHDTADDGTPSSVDLENWAASLSALVRDGKPPSWLLGNEIALDCWTGIIVTRSAGGSWTYPQLHAWVTRWEHAGFICEPAALTEW